MNRFSSIFLLLLFGVISCDRSKNSPPRDTPSNGKISISVDESFQTVMAEQVRMYEAIYPKANIEVQYKSEADCLRDFFRDSMTRIIIVTRGLQPDEEKRMQRSLGYNPGWNAIASDAIGIIVNSESTDTLFTLDRLRAQLNGKINRHQQIVFDGLNATSTIRFMTDSVLRNKSFDTSVVKAARSSSDVIKYVAEHGDAIGFVGISWIGNPEDTSHLRLLKKVKIAYMQCNTCADSIFIKPSQESILSKRYPLVRGLYYAVKENYTGLGTGFINFLKHEQGQLIFKRAYLGPVMGFAIRNVRINEELPSK